MRRLSTRAPGLLVLLWGFVGYLLVDNRPCLAQEIEKGLRRRASEKWQGRILKRERGIESVDVSSDGRWLVAGTKQDTRLWNLKTDDPPARCIVLRGSAGRISPDGRWLTTVVNDRVIWLWNLKAEDPSAEGKEVARCEDDWKSLRGLAIGPNNRWLVTISDDRVLRLWDLKATGKGSKPRVLMERARQRDIWRSPDGRWLTAPGGDGKVGVWDLAADHPGSKALTYQITIDKKHARMVGPMGISPDGRWLVTVGASRGGAGGVRHLWDLRAKAPWARAVGELGDADQLRCLEFSADSRWLVTCGDDGQARLYDLTTSDPAKRPIELAGNTKPSNIESVAFSPNGRWLIVTDGPTVHLSDMNASNRFTKPVVLKGHTGSDLSAFLLVSPNSRWLVTRSPCIWDLDAEDTTAVHAVLGDHGEGEKRFSRDSRWLVSLDRDKTARLWDMAAMQSGAVKSPD
jgi:WD40 repeat protein